MISRTFLRASRNALFASRTTPSVTSLPASRVSILSRLPSHPYQPTAFSTSSFTRYPDAATEESKTAPSESSTQTSANLTEKPADAPNAEVEKLKADLKAKSDEVVNLKDQYMRSVADYRNLQERTKREVQAAKDFALQRFAKDLMDSLDTFEHALSSVPAEKLAKPPSIQDTDSPASVVESLHKELVSLQNGIVLTEKVLHSTLSKHGLERFDPSINGEKFNPNEHEAVFMSPMAGKEDGIVMYTQQKGYKLNGRVIRAPKVGVVKNA